MHGETIILTVEISADDAEQFAQFCKRITHTHCYNLTESHLPDQERNARAYQMLAGIEAVRDALAQAGHNPR